MFNVERPRDGEPDPDFYGRNTPPDDTRPDGVPGPLLVAGLASLGGGAVHAAAAGAHGDPRQAAIAFVALGVAQIGWGALALFRSHRLVAALGVAVNGAAVGGWLMAKTSGIGFIEGLEESESVQFADGVGAALAVVAVLGALVSVAGRVAEGRRAPSALAVLASVATLAVVAPAMVQTGSHSHAGGGHGHGHDEAAAGHGDHGEHGGGEGGHEHAAAPTPPEPYDATLPVNLGGVPGVTAEQQAWAEDLVTRTLEDLPQFADAAEAEARGWYSIGDGASGHEHFINWDTIDDDTVFDPNEPESLVYEVAPDGTRTLVAAMFMLPTDVPLDEAPDDGGPLVQFHVHTDLCYTDDPVRPVLGGLTTPGGECAPPLVRHEPSPMAHVWITPHECGPFASLEGVGAGQVVAGEERACDHAHGAT